MHACTRTHARTHTLALSPPILLSVCLSVSLSLSLCFFALFWEPVKITVRASDQLLIFLFLVYTDLTWWNTGNYCLTQNPAHACLVWWWLVVVSLLPEHFTSCHPVVWVSSCPVQLCRSVQFSSRWYLWAWKSPCTLHHVSEVFPTLSLKLFQCLCYWWWPRPSPIFSRKIV